MMQSVWLDADPGFDDWMTMLVLANAHQTGKLNWHGMSIVHGNAPLAVTARNAAMIAQAFGLSVPTYPGSAVTVANETPATAQNVLGADGMRTSATALSDLVPSTANVALRPDGVNALISFIENSETPVTLVAIGPLTNVALALLQRPSISKRIAELIVMGGSTDRGNHTPAAEFNFYADPQAASIVFNSGVNIKMFGLNVCRQVLLNQTDVAGFKGLTSPLAQCFSGYLDGYQKIRSVDGSVPMPIYDPVVAAYLLQPALFTLEPARVDIECQGQFTRGMSVCNFKQGVKPNFNACVATSCQTKQIKRLLLQSLMSVFSK
jgi:purine nucleosidase